MNLQLHLSELSDRDRRMRTGDSAVPEKTRNEGRPGGTAPAAGEGLGEEVQSHASS